MKKNQEWDKIIISNPNNHFINIKEIWEYRELVTTLVKKNFVTSYKQTILGPLWAFISPFVTSVLFTIIFGKIAKLSTDGIPEFLYYFSSIIFWNYFSHCLSSISTTFISHKHLMKKVYFPRFIMPITSICTNLISVGIQSILLIGFYLFYYFTGANIHLELSLLLLPLYFLQLILLSTGIGCIFASITTKYRDLGMVFSFIIQLWMYSTPITYSSSIIPSNLYTLYHLNPVTPTLEWITYSLFGIGNPSISFFIYSIIISIIIFIIGIRFFQKSERTFIDTI